MANITIGIDLGGTKIQAAAMRDQAIIGTFRLATPQSGERDVSAAIVAASDAALAEAEAHRSEVRGVGIGAPGTIDSEAGTVSSSPNLPGFQTAEPVPLGSMVSEGLVGAPVMIDNDVRVAILGEWKRGAGRGFRQSAGRVGRNRRGRWADPERRAVPRAGRSGRDRPHHREAGRPRVFGRAERTPGGLRGSRPDGGLRARAARGRAQDQPVQDHGEEGPHADVQRRDRGGARGE